MDKNNISEATNIAEKKDQGSSIPVYKTEKIKENPERKKRKFKRKRSGLKISVDKEQKESDPQAPKKKWWQDIKFTFWDW